MWAGGLGEFCKSTELEVFVPELKTNVSRGALKAHTPARFYSWDSCFRVFAASHGHCMNISWNATVLCSKKSAAEQRTVLHFHSKELETNIRCDIDVASECCQCPKTPESFLCIFLCPFWVNGWRMTIHNSTLFHHISLHKFGVWFYLFFFLYLFYLCICLTEISQQLLDGLSIASV